jgi:hypothetical protein
MSVGVFKGKFKSNDMRDTIIREGLWGICSPEYNTINSAVKPENYLKFLLGLGDTLFISPVQTKRSQFIIFVFKNNELVDTHYIVESNGYTRREISEIKAKIPWIVKGKLIDLTKVEG